jgi:uncharacterized membrane protein
VQPEYIWKRQTPTFGTFGSCIGISAFAAIGSQLINAGPMVTTWLLHWRTIILLGFTVFPCVFIRTGAVVAIEKTGTVSFVFTGRWVAHVFHCLTQLPFIA